MAAISINHVSIHAEDLEESAAFYEHMFGCTGSSAQTRSRRSTTTLGSSEDNPSLGGI